MPVYKDEKTNTWYCKFYYTDYTGTRKQKLKRGFALQRDAKDWERNFLEKVQGTPDITLQALYEAYIEDKSHRLKASSIQTKKRLIKKHILPHFKDKPINQITAADIRAWQNKLIAKDFSGPYLSNIHVALSSIFTYAVQYYNLPYNPCSRAGSIGKKSRSLNFWTLTEFNQVLNCVDDIIDHTALKLLFYSGIRLGEFRALTYGDLDFNNNIITINKNMQIVDSKEIVYTPKSENGTRLITMPDAIMDDLKAYCGKIYGISSNDRIFPFKPHRIRKCITDKSAAAGVKNIRIHDLRHSHVSLLIELGFTPYLIAERIGDTVQMVNEVYGHLYPNKHIEVANKLNKILVSN